MREHKYRAWDKIRKVMVYWDSYIKKRNKKEVYPYPLALFFDGSPMFGMSGGFDSEGYERSTNWKAGSGMYEVMQYTGLKDKNGKDIYEGDIVKLNVRNRQRNEDQELYIIDWDQDEAFYYLKAFPDQSYSLYNIHWNNQYTVIGNIYENPELLK